MGWPWAHGGDPLLQKRRRPFSRTRCLLRPCLAADPNECEPFAKVIVKVDRASALLNDASTNEVLDTMDSYVWMQMNGQGPTQQTAVRHGTLAPRWDQTFEFDLHHPESVLEVRVYDQDLLGNDDLIGFIDVLAGKLPLNQSVSGWFQLLHGRLVDIYDTLNLRLQKVGNYGGIPPTTGWIRLEFMLVVPRALDMAFAMSLYRSDFGHFLEPLHLDLLYEETKQTNLKQKSRKEMFKQLVQQAKAQANQLAIAFIVCLWTPYLLLPFLLLVFTLAVESLRRLHREVLAVERGAPACAWLAKLGLTVGPVLVLPGLPGWPGGAPAGPQPEPVTSTAEIPPQSRSDASQAQHASEELFQTDPLKQMVTNFAAALPQKNQIGLRKMHGHVRRALMAMSLFDKALQRRGVIELTVYAITAVVILFVRTEVLWPLFRKWVCRVLLILLTAGAVALTSLGRFVQNVIIHMMTGVKVGVHAHFASHAEQKAIELRHNSALALVSTARSKSRGEPPDVKVRQVPLGHA